MGITLNRNSWHFKYYSSIVSETPPKSLCPYFWTMVLLFILSPFFGFTLLILHLIKQINNGVDYIKYLFRSQTSKVEKPKKSIDELMLEFEKSYAADLKNSRRWTKFGGYLAKGFKWVFLPIMGLFLLYNLCLGAYDAGWLVTLITFLIIGTIVAILFGSIYLIETYGSIMGEGLFKFFQFINPLNWNVTIIIGEMIKTTYTKACPLITWEGIEKKSNRFDSVKKQA